MKTTHDRMEEAGLLDGRLDPRTRAAWPAWASEHAATCPDCIALILLDARLSSRFADGGEPPPVPSPEALRSRLAARRAPPPLTMLVARAPAFSPGVYRGGALEITRTERGVRAYDPDATHLVMFGVADGRVELLGDAEALVEGVVAEAELAPDRPVRVVALAARGPLDGELVRLWLADQPEGAPLDVASAGDRVHLTEVDVAPRLAPGLLRLAEGELPPTSAEVTALLGEGREAGSAGHSARAAEAYRRALARSSELGDRTGELKATLGLAMALRDLGYMEDALRLFSSVAARHALNRQLGSMFARAMMNRQLWRRSAAEAERWEAEALRLTPGVTAFAASARAEIALLRGQLEEAHEVLRGVSLDGLKDGPRIFLELFRARALAAIGEPAAARAALGAIRIPDGMAFEMTAIRLCVEVDVSRRAGEPVAWDEVVARVRAGVGDRLQDAEASYLYEVAEGALAAGHADVARALLHLRFAPHDEAPEEARILVASFADSSLVSTPTATCRVPRGDVELKDLAAAARAAIQRGEWASPAAVALREVLGLDALGPVARLCLAQDGALADLPFAALVAGPHGALPVVRELVPGVPRLAAPTSSRVVSLADAAGDLPAARDEVGSEVAATRLRGPAVTRAALAHPGEVGLLHVAVHLRRDRGVPELVLADGPIAPAEVEELSYEGHPIVLLSSCGSAARATESGVEWSFAHAFLRAGASAVIATRWPVLDHEFQHFVRALLAAWPFTDAAVATAAACDELRRSGAHPRLWTALVVYTGP